MRTVVQRPPRGVPAAALRPVIVVAGAQKRLLPSLKDVREHLGEEWEKRLSKTFAEGSAPRGVWVLPHPDMEG
jgi:hypothetical protein